MEGRRSITSRGNRAISIFLAFLMVLLLPAKVFGQEPDPLAAIAGKTGCSYEDILLSDMFIPGETVSDWIAIATGCSDKPVKRNAYLRGLEEYVTKAYTEKGALHTIKATEWHRISLAVLALGGDPASFGEDGSGNPINLIADGTFNWTVSDSLGMQGLNGWIFALITLDAGNYEVPEDALYTREEMINQLLSAQTGEGGFGLSAGSADVDITAMTLQALAPYCRTDPDVQAAVDKALDWLSAQQSETGDFISWGSCNAESTAQTVIALCSLGIDPHTDSRFIKNGNSAMDGLLQYQTESGMFRHTLDGEEDVMATEQASLALIAVRRLAQGRRLYDFTEVAVYTGSDDTAETGQENTPRKSPVIWIAAGAGMLVIAAGTAVILIRRGKSNVRDNRKNHP